MMYFDGFQVMDANLKKNDALLSALRNKYNLITVSTGLCLGINICHPFKDTLINSQGRYARALINRHGLKDCKPAPSPIEKPLELNKIDSAPDKKDDYNKIIGGLQYLASNTRPDISLAVNCDGTACRVACA